jgi:hypothetical protein
MQGEIQEQLIRDAQRNEEQLRAGMNLALDFIRRFASEVDCPAMGECSFAASHRDFDYDQYSILDARERVVVKVARNELTDAVSPQTPEVRRAFETKLRSALISHFRVPSAA